MPPEVTAFPDTDIVGTLPTSAGGQTAAFFGHPVMALRDTPAAWLKDVLGRIGALSTLGHDWDSYGAVAVDPLSIRSAKELIRRLSWVHSVNAPTVTATGDGDVGFCWDAGDWSLDAEVGPTGHISYVYLDERDHAKDRDTSTDDSDELAELLTGW